MARFDMSHTGGHGVWLASTLDQERLRNNVLLRPARSPRGRGREHDVGILCRSECEAIKLMRSATGCPMDRVAGQHAAVDIARAIILASTSGADPRRRFSAALRVDDD